MAPWSCEQFSPSGLEKTPGVLLKLTGVSESFLSPTPYFTSKKMRYREWWQNPGQQLRSFPHYPRRSGTSSGHVAALRRQPCQNEHGRLVEPEGTNLILQQRKLTPRNWNPREHLVGTVITETCLISRTLTRSAAVSSACLARATVHQVSGTSKAHSISNSHSSPTR